MSSSFEHTIVRFTPETEEAINAAFIPRCSGSTRAKTCANRIKWACGWRYVTGAAGRVSTAQRNYCDDHARKFCRAYRLAIPGELVPPAEVKP